MKVFIFLTAKKYLPEKNFIESFIMTVLQFQKFYITPF